MSPNDEGPPIANAHARGSAPAGGGEIRRQQVSVVIVSHDEGANLERTVRGYRATISPSDEIVVVDDGSTDGSCDFISRDPSTARLIRPARLFSVPAARNLGARVSGGDVIVHSDAHVDPRPGWLEPLLDALADPSVGQVGPTISSRDEPNRRGYGFTWGTPALRVAWLGRQGDTPYEVPFIGTMCMAMRREVIDATGCFDEGMYRYGSADIELSLRLWLLGYRCVLVPTSEAGHLYRDQHTFEPDRGGIAYNMLRIATIHLDQRQATRVLTEHARAPSFAKAWTRLIRSNAWARKARLAEERVHDSDWFLDRFDIDVFA